MKENPMSTTINPTATPITDPPPAATTDVAQVGVTLRCFAPGGDLEGHPAVTQYGSTVVVLGYSRDNAEIVDVYGDHDNYPLAADTHAAVATDSARCTDLLRAALAHLTERLRDARTEQATVKARHERTLDEIRRYAIDQHLNDEYCRSGLNEFLRTFRMPIYEPRVRVSYTITGSYEVDGDDTYSATRDATGYLKTDLSQIDGVLEDTDHFTVEVSDTTSLDT
jgi:hypothetical protein